MYMLNLCDRMNMQHIFRAFANFFLWITFHTELLSCQQLPACKKEATKFALTQCDEQNGMWRVRVPYNESFQCTPEPSPPQRIITCETVCKAGYFYNLEELSASCTECRAGTFSVGNAQNYADWITLPIGFSAQSAPLVQTNKINHLFDSGTEDSAHTVCTKQTWTPRGDHIALEEGEGCIAKLLLEVDLIKDGYVEFEYQYPESSLMFMFSTIRSECKSASGRLKDTQTIKTFPEQTYRTLWASTNVTLQKGKQTLVWTGISMASGTQDSSYKPIRIRSVTVAGVKYSAMCTPCPAGTYSSSGSSKCLECPQNSSSTKGSVQCTSCPQHQYALPGFARCFDRPVCTKADYRKVVEECQPDGYARFSYEWIDPKICREDGTVQLASVSDRIPCPKCPKGMVRYNASFCDACGENQFADELGICQNCPNADWIPAYFYDVTEWNYVPYGMGSLCWSPTPMGCANEAGWQLNNDSIISGYGHEDDALLVLQLATSGFRDSESQSVFATLSFEFEMICRSLTCQLDFILEDTESVGRIKSWTGSQNRQQFDFPITRNASLALSWIFVKQISQGLFTGDGSKRKYGNDLVRIFSIRLTNTMDGGATSCKPCTVKNSGQCRRCPPNEHFSSVTQKCESCPPNHVMSFQTGLCVPCGENLVATNGKCVSNCKATLRNGKKHYNLTALKGFHIKPTKHFFQATGETYYHQYNISFCTDEPAVCHNTVYKPGSSNARNSVSGLVCRLTTLLSSDGTNTTTAVQSFVAGQELIGISEKAQMESIKVENHFDHLVPEFTPDQAPDFHYFFRSMSSVSPSCPSGRSAIVTLRCSKNVTTTVDIHVPGACPDGTCDGCNYHFLWLTRYACPVCGPKDYTIVRGECTAGKQNMYYHSNAYCLETNSSSNLTRKLDCASVPLSVQIILIVLTFVGIVLIVIVVLLFRSAKAYQYRYMKLVQDASGVVHLQLPESCVDDHELDVDTGQDENDQGYDVEFRTPSETVYTKVKKAVTKKKDLRKLSGISEGSREENQLLTE